MESILITVYADMNKRLGCSTDDIAFDPDYRTEFLDRCGQSTEKYSVCLSIT